MEVINDNDEIIIGYEWGRTFKDDPIPRPLNITVNYKSEMFKAGNVKDIEQCAGAVIVLTSEGKVMSCGSNKYGVLGIPDLPQQIQDKRLRELNFNNAKISEIATGEYHAMALTREGKVYTWGCNTYGQLGIPNKSRFITEEDKSPERDATISNIKQAGQKKKIIATPTLINIDRPVNEIIAIDNSSYALDEDGNVWSWGMEQYIGRVRGEVAEENEDGIIVKVPANHVPRKVKIIDNNGTEYKVTHIMKKRKKIIALLQGDEQSIEENSKSDDGNESQKLSIPEIKDNMGGDLLPEGKKNEPLLSASKQRMPGKSMHEASMRSTKFNNSQKVKIDEHVMAEYELIKDMIETCNSSISIPLKEFEDNLLELVNGYKAFMDDPFKGIINEEDKNVVNWKPSTLKALHVNIKNNLNTLELINAEFKAIKNKYAMKTEEKTEGRLGIITKFLLDNLEDSMKLKRLGLLAFKLHSYHLRLKHRNILSWAASNLGVKCESISSLSDQLKGILIECEYILKRFSDLEGEFNKAYDDKTNALASRTAYHMLDATYSECQAWKYVTTIGKYAMIYQTGYENLLSVSDKMERLYALYMELRKGDIHQMIQSYSSAVKHVDQRNIIGKARDHISYINGQIIQAKAEICSEAIDKDPTHKKILTEAYEILLDSGMLRLAYYDLFTSFYDKMIKAEKSVSMKAQGETKS